MDHLRWIELVLWASVCYRLVNRISTFEVRCVAVFLCACFQRVSSLLTVPFTSNSTEVWMYPRDFRVGQFFQIFRSTTPKKCHNLYRCSHSERPRSLHWKHECTLQGAWEKSDGSEPRNIEMLQKQWFGGLLSSRPESQGRRPVYCVASRLWFDGVAVPKTVHGKRLGHVGARSQR